VTAHSNWSRRISAALTCTVLACALAGTLTASGQTPDNSGANKEGTKPPATTAPPTPAAPTPPTTPATPAAKLSPEEERQAQLAADTAKLFQFAQELKAEVDKSSKDTLSLAVIKKAAEVEKLARELKERMKAEEPKSK
jgi:sRNA-binding protein